MVPTPRAVAICVVYARQAPSDAGPTFLVTSSRKHKGKYVLPKGGIEHGETSIQAALREAGEEAGLKTEAVRHVASLGSFDDSKPHKDDPSVPSTTYEAELFVLNDLHTTEDALESHWLESHERTRAWVKGFEQLKDTVCWGRRERALREIIDRVQQHIMTESKNAR